MRPLVNLASEPFQNRRLFWAFIIGLFLVSFVFGIRIFSEVSGYRSDIELRETLVKKLELQLLKSVKPIKTDIKISADQNLQLAAAYDLITKKSFSWSQLLNDIEANIPPGVRVLKIGIVQSEDVTLLESSNGIVLSMDVIGKSQTDVTKMIDKLNVSGKFKPFPESQKTLEGSEEIEFRLKIEYFPKG